MYIYNDINTGSMYVERDLLKLSKMLKNSRGNKDFQLIGVETVSQRRWNLAEPIRREEF